MNVLSQETLVYSQLTIEDGLPSNEVHWTYQDDQGYLWICTDHGVVKYNGLSMKFFTRADGLPDNAVFKCYPDPQKRLWFTTYTGGVFYIKNDSVHIPQFNQTLLDQIDRRRIEQIHFDEYDSIWMSTFELNQSYYKTCLGSSEVKAYQVSPVDNCLRTVFLLKKDHKALLSGAFVDTAALNRANCKYDTTIVKSKRGYDITTKPYCTSCNPDPNKIEWKRMERYSWGERFGLRSATLNYQDTLEWMFVAQKLYRVKDGEIQLFRHFKDHIIEIYRDEYYFMVFTQANGLDIYSVKGEDLEHKGEFLEGFQIAHINRDNQGNYWVSTTNSGLLKIESFEVMRMNLPAKFGQSKEVAWPWHYAKDTVRVLLHDTLFVYRNVGNSFEQVNFQVLENWYKDHYKSVAWDGLGNVYYGFERWNYNQNKRGLLSPPRIEASREIQISSDGVRVSFLGRLGYRIYQADTLVFESVDFDFKATPTVLLILDNAHHLIGCLDRLYEYRDGKYINWGDKYTQFDSRIEDIQLDMDGNIWVATRGFGLGVIGKDSVWFLDQNDGLNSNLVNKLLVDQNKIYAGTNSGLNQIIRKASGEYLITQLLNQTNEGSWFINDIFKDGNKVAVQSDHQFTILGSEFQPNIDFEPQLVFDDINILGESHPLPVASRLKLRYNQNNVGFSFRINELSNQEEVIYKYRLKGLSDDWTTSGERTVTYSSLRPEDYSFEVSARGSNGRWSSVGAFDFSIAPPFYRSRWFISSMTIVGFILIFVYNRQRKLRTERSKRLILSNLNALKNQMNPHFIFNSLNSIQYYIATSQGREANLFLSKLSDLVRNILKSSSQASISLAEELQRLRDYLELESMRLNGAFEFEIQVEKDIDQNRTFIPPLLVQPIIENSIWHGMSEINYKGSLNIHASIDQAVLRLEISDNGIGMDIEKWESDPSGCGKGNSIGLYNIVQRLRLLSKVQNREYRVLLKNLQGEPRMGTIVTLIIPQ